MAPVFSSMEEFLHHGLSTPVCPICHENLHDVSPYSSDTPATTSSSQPTDSDTDTLIHINNCGHEFHRPCLMMWVSKGGSIAEPGENTCPSCRGVLFRKGRTKDELDAVIEWVNEDVHDLRGVIEQLTPREYDAVHRQLDQDARRVVDVLANGAPAVWQVDHEEDLIDYDDDEEEGLQLGGLASPTLSDMFDDYPQEAALRELEEDRQNALSAQEDALRTRELQLDARHEARELELNARLEAIRNAEVALRFREQCVESVYSPESRRAVAQELGERHREQAVREHGLNALEGALRAREEYLRRREMVLGCR